MRSESLAQRIRHARVANGAVALWWLGGSGFVFKSPDGAVIYIDPYLSNCVKELFDIGRAFPPPIEAEDVKADAVIATHWHEDHLDPVSIPIIAKSDPGTTFIMPPSAAPHASHLGVPRSRIRTLAAEQRVEVGGFVVIHVPARHESGIPGWEVPDAMGVILEVQGLRIYISGDTEYDTRLRNLKSQNLDAGIFCINGVTGNMDAHEAALLAWQLRVRIAIPMHHYLWDKHHADATLDPTLMKETYARLGGKGSVVIPEVGNELVLSSNSSA